MKARRRSLSLPSVPLSNAGGRESQGGSIEAGAGPYAVGREGILMTSGSSSAGVARGGAIPMIDPIEATICVTTGGDMLSA